jgi:tetratricopeptide (TPR) repeat protein
MRLSRIISASSLCIGLTVFLAMVAVSSVAHADALLDINKLLKQGQQAQALDQVDKYLADKPKDAQGRFLKGLILTEMNKPNDAIAVFQKLTEDYPELPEPYNNMAVIYAQQKQYDKAKQALEMAIRTHPSYATAHENLGDIYSRMASQAYDKALQLDSSNTSAQTKLSMIRNLIGNSARPGTTVAAVKPVVVATAETKPPVAATPPPTPPTTPKVSETRPIEPAKTIEPKPAPAAEPAKTPTKPAGDPSAEVTKAVEAWAAVWSRKDVKAYLACYAKDFKTPNGEPRAKWEADRTTRIGKPGAIQVGVDGLKVSMDGADKATVHFRQHYKSASLKTSTSKALALVHQDGKWLIQQERIGN